MKVKLTTLLILSFALIWIMGCGCSGVSPLVPPAYGYTGDNCDVWPIFWGTDNGGPDNGYVTFYDQGTGAWDAGKVVGTGDLLNAQWTPQRNGIGWDTAGKWNVSFIEDTSNDLELWESAGTGWDDGAGAWAMTDDDATQNWIAVDVETRQNYVWACCYAGGIIHPFYIDLNAGAPNWTAVTTTFDTTLDNGNFSIVLDKNNQGYITLVGEIITAVHYAYVHPSPPAVNIIYNTTTHSGAYPQVLESFATNIFYTYSNVLRYIPHTLYWPNIVYENVYTATVLTDDYHATWLKIDDTIHVVLVDYSVASNATYLIYLRRTPNGWTAPVTLRTVDSNPGGASDTMTWPQICVDTLGNIFVSYIYMDNQFAATGDLCGYYLDAVDYSTYTVIGAGGWIAHTNIDQSATAVVWAIMPDSIPIAADM